MKPFRIAAHLLLSFVPLSLAACVSPQEAGWNAYRHERFDEAAGEWDELAFAGDADAQYMLGLLNDEGRIEGASAAAAVRWYQLAAEQGHAAAQNNLALCHFGGRGTPRDLELARQWFELAAAQGFAKAENNLAVLCLLLEPSESERAQALLASAAAKGEPKAEALLATLGR
ncbi:MAG: tetratricopeptide repeat protein [Planctomycetota bacterium]|nr:tetratricopeptide repeat protein [Planctomycetota bacterium]